MASRRSICLILIALTCSIFTAADVLAQDASPAMSSATVAPGTVVASFPGMEPALRLTLAEQGHEITVTVRDSLGDPVSGVDPGRITFEAENPARLTLHEPLVADGPTDALGQTTIGGYLNASGIPLATVVRLDGVDLGSGPLPLEVAAADAQEGMVDLLDAFLMVDAWNAGTLGTYTAWKDLNRDLVVDLADLTLQTHAMGQRYPGTPDPFLSTPEGTLGLYQDSAGTIGEIDYDPLETGGILTLYLVAKGLPDPMGALEYRIPRFEDPEVTLLTPDWQRPTFQFRSELGADYQSVFAVPPPAGLDVIIAQFNVLIPLPVVNMTFDVTALPDPYCSFLAPNRPGWTSTGIVYRRPFAGTSSAVLNPTEFVFDGLDHVLEGDGFLEDILDGMRFSLPNGGSGGMSMGMGSAGGAGGAGSDGHYMEILSTLDGGQLPVGASITWDYEDDQGTPLVSLASVHNGTAFDMKADMLPLGAATVQLELFLGGDLLDTRTGYSGNWTSDAGQGSTQWILRTGQDLTLVQAFDAPVNLVLDDQSQLQADVIRITPENAGPVPENFLKSVHMTGVDIPPVEIGREGLLRFDAGYLGAQNLFLVSQERNLHFLVLDPAQPGHLTLGSTDGLPIDFRGIPVSSPGGGPAGLVTDYRHSGGSQLPGLQLTLDEQGPDVGIQLGFLAQGSQSCGVVALLGGQVVDQFAGMDEFIGLAGAWPSSQGMEGSELVLRWLEPTDLGLNAPQAKAAVSADELRLAPVDPSGLPEGREIDVTLVGSGRMVVTQELAASPAPPGTPGLALHPNVPNPFNPATEFRFALPAAGRVSLRVYDLRGRLVATPLDEWRGAGEGRVVWNGRDHSGRAVASGVYHAVLEEAGQRRTRKITLLK